MAGEHDLYAALMVPGDGPLELLARLVQPPWWHEYARCRGQGTEMFYPARGAPTEPARAVCGECAVWRDCLDDALANGEKHGIWGGMSERQRRRMRRERHEAA